MSRICDLTGKSAQKAANRSHAKNKTLRRQQPNVQSKKYLIPELGKTITINVCTAAIRNITKFGGITQAILKAKDENLSAELQKVKRALVK